jgi:hypothetical protein
VGIAGSVAAAREFEVKGRAPMVEGIRMRRLAIGAAITAFAAAAAVGAAPGAGAAVGDARDEAGWILSAQLPDGSIASHADRTFVDPYLSAFGAAGLAAATRATGDPAYAQGAWRFVEWYAAHMDANGYVTDYRVVGETISSTGDADSTDAYAGLFLLAVEAASAAAPDPARLMKLAPALRSAVAAIRSTQRVDGLTGAKPAWMVAYLMNEAEAYAGLMAASRLALTVGDRALARDAALAAARIQRGVDRLWNASTDAFDWAVHPDGARQATNWAQLYPDALSQVWAVRYGVVQGPRARAVLTRFLQAHPNAHDPNAPDLVDGRVAPTGYWPGAAIALRLVDPAAPSRYGAGTVSVAAATGRAWPYSVQVAGDLVRLTTNL